MQKHNNVQRHSKYKRIGKRHTEPLTSAEQHQQATTRTQAVRNPKLVVKKHNANLEMKTTPKREK